MVLAVQPPAQRQWVGAKGSFTGGAAVGLPSAAFTAKAATAQASGDSIADHT